jgi:hypothetical protein
MSQSQGSKNSTFWAIDWSKRDEISLQYTLNEFSITMVVKKNCFIMRKIGVQSTVVLEHWCTIKSMDSSHSNKGQVHSQTFNRLILDSWIAAMYFFQYIISSEKYVSTLGGQLFLPTLLMSCRVDSTAL